MNIHPVNYLVVSASVSLMDANGQVIETKQVTTNAYGTAAVLVISILAINVMAYGLMQRLMKRYSVRKRPRF